MSVVSISGNGGLKEHFPDWEIKHNVRQILTEIYQANAERWNNGSDP